MEKYNGTNWRNDARCRDSNDERFFPSAREVSEETKLFCGGCAVKEYCLEYAIRTGTESGVWSGVNFGDARQRYKARHIGRAMRAL